MSDMSENREAVLKDVIVLLDGFVTRQLSRLGNERHSEDRLEGLQMARETLADIAAGRMRL